MLRRPFESALAAAIAVMDEAAALDRPAFVECLLQRIQHEAGMCRPADPPADDAAGEDVDHEGDVDEAGPGRDVGEVRDPQLVRRAAPGTAGSPGRAGTGAALSLTVVRTGLPRTTPCRPSSRISRSTVQRATVEAFAPQLPPDLAHAVDLEVLVEDARDLGLQGQRPAAPAPTAASGSARLAAWA